jgi:rhomboid family GlyGly-CTERM serine protease
MTITPRWHCVAWLLALSLLANRWPGALQALAWQREAIADGQWGRILTAHLAHLDTRHLIFNLLGLVLIAELLLEGWRLRDLLSLLLASALGTSLLLWIGEPGLRWYAGLSGLLHGLWAGAALLGWLRQRNQLAAIALAALALKLLLLDPTSGPTSGPTPVVGVAHGYGTLSGILWTLVRTATFHPTRQFD